MAELLIRLMVMPLHLLILTLRFLSDELKLIPADRQPPCR
jgi:hypothetical protein